VPYFFTVIALIGGTASAGVWLVSAPAHAQRLLQEGFLGTSPVRQPRPVTDAVIRCSGLVLIAWAAYLTIGVLDLGQALFKG
jgi:hypothetical protein